MNEASCSRVFRLFVNSYYENLKAIKKPLKTKKKTIFYSKNHCFSTPGSAPAVGYQLHVETVDLHPGRRVDSKKATSAALLDNEHWWIDVISDIIDDRRRFTLIDGAIVGQPIIGS